MKILSYIRHNSGFSLIEVMIALVVLLFGILGVMAMQYIAVGGNAASRELRVATVLAQTKIEDLKTIPYDSIASGTDVPQSSAALTGGISFTRRWWVVKNCIDLTLTQDNNTCSANINAACNTAVSNVAIIRLRTCWKDRNGADHSVTFDTIRWDEGAGL
ncbi:MAG: prepilin-type N-terminal cleavage/methylation domain-containing protein [Nitrospirae bacterium]|nr:prepilin-type N-terminal cleavage/methylation domain-containing protein [Nitrospirota bacterium]